MANGLAVIRRGSGLKDFHLSDVAGIRRHKIAHDDRYFYDNFKGRPLCAKTNGAGAATGTAGDTNQMYTGKNVFEYFIIGTQTVVAPVVGTGGLDIKFDDGATGGDGVEFSLGITSQAPAAYVVGTDEFYMKIKVNVADQSGLAQFFAGFRLAEAYQAAITGYDTYGAIGYKRVNASTTGDIYIASELDGDASADVDTTDDFVEGTDYTFEVRVDKGGNFKFFVNGALPSTTKTLQATSGDVLVPFFRQVDHADTPGATLIKEFECGLLDANVR
jgi:hypothetical protein